MPRRQRRNSVAAAAIVVIEFVAVAFAASGCVRARTPVVRNPGTQGATAPTPIAAAEFRGAMQSNAVVEYVNDGDTIVARLGRTLAKEVGGGDSKDDTESVRLIGIDTPESKKPNTPVECFSQESAKALRSLIPPGTNITIELDSEHRDRYGRLLGYIMRSSDGLFVNHEMARTGMAVALSYRPNTTYAQQFQDTSDAAQRSSVGLWSACDGGHEPKT